MQFSGVKANRNYTLPSLCLELPSAALAKAQDSLETLLLPFYSTYSLFLQFDSPHHTGSLRTQPELAQLRLECEEDAEMLSAKRISNWNLKNEQVLHYSCKEFVVAVAGLPSPCVEAQRGDLQRACGARCDIQYFI